MRRIRVKDHHRRDFEFYLHFANRVPVFDPGGDVFARSSTLHQDASAPSALECFVANESTGSVPTACASPREYTEAIRGKRLVNFHIKMWAKGIAEELFVVSEFQQDFPDAPPWVWDALRQQVGKYA